MKEKEPKNAEAVIKEILNNQPPTLTNGEP
jgi:hypothetical protein